MGNIFKFFLYTLPILILVGCEKINIKINCEKFIEKTYSNSSLNNFEKNKFQDLFNDRYVQYEQMFHEASLETKIDKNLLAAISFQESQWDPRAQSTMGVRGMMMVTLETAKLVGVEKRLNPEQNIKGGARYLAILMDKNKIGSTESDELSIILASYNLGPTNIINVASLISDNPKNIKWQQIQEQLSKLSGKDLNLIDTKNYSRGQQAIDYVNRVKDYYKILSAHECIAPKDQLTFS